MMGGSAGEPIYRPYRGEVLFPSSPHKLRIENLEFLEFPDVDRATAAVAWIAHQEMSEASPQPSEYVG
jgi:hypothetical protein